MLKMYLIYIGHAAKRKFGSRRINIKDCKRGLPKDRCVPFFMCVGLMREICDEF